MRPRTKLYVRLSCVRLPPWIFNGEALIGHGDLSPDWTETLLSVVTRTP
jgi:hypothetical protein